MQQSSLQVHQRRPATNPEAEFYQHPFVATGASRAPHPSYDRHMETKPPYSADQHATTRIASKPCTAGVVVSQRRADRPLLLSDHVPKVVQFTDIYEIEASQWTRTA